MGGRGSKEKTFSGGECEDNTHCWNRGECIDNFCHCSGRNYFDEENCAKYHRSLFCKTGERAGCHDRGDCVDGECVCDEPEHYLYRENCEYRHESTTCDTVDDCKPFHGLGYYCMFGECFPEVRRAEINSGTMDAAQTGGLVVGLVAAVAMTVVAGSWISRKYRGGGGKEGDKVELSRSVEASTAA